MKEQKPEQVVALSAKHEVMFLPPPGAWLRTPVGISSSTALAVQSKHGVARVTALVLPADIGDQRLRVLHLHLERGNQPIFRIHGDVAALSLQLEPNGKFQWRSPIGRRDADFTA